MTSNASTPAQVAVVVLARDAAATIAPTLRSIGSQHALRPGSPVRAEVVVVVNGSRDHTALVAHDTWTDLRRAGVTDAALRIRIIDEAGHANAWNVAVHEVTSAASVLVFCDSDIGLVEPDALDRLVHALRDDPAAVMASPARRTSPARVRSRLVRWSARRDPAGAYSGGAFAGGCYAVRGDFARSMELPRTVTVDAGFLHAMAVTSQFTTEPDPSRVVRVPGASFVFDGAATLRTLLAHERNLAIGATYNAYAFRALHEQCGELLPAGAVLIARNRVRPHWIDDLVVAEKQRGRRWFVPRAYVTRRFDRLAPLPRRPHRLAIVALLLMVGFVSDLMMSVWVNEYFRALESGSVF